MTEIRGSCTVLSIEEDDEFVYTRYRDGRGAEHTIKSRFLVGADGKTGFTRKHYLEPKGIVMEKASQSVFNQRADLRERANL